MAIEYFNKAWVVKDTISSEKLLLLALSSLCDDDGYVIVSSKYLENFMNLCKRSIKHILKSLVTKGFIHVEHRFSDDPYYNKGQLENRYKILI